MKHVKKVSDCCAAKFTSERIWSDVIYWHNIATCRACGKVCGVVNIEDYGKHRRTWDDVFKEMDDRKAATK